MVVLAAMVAAEGCCMSIGYGCLQRAATTGAARQPSARCGTTSRMALAASTYILGQLGLQKTMAGCYAHVGFSEWDIIGRRCKRLLWLAGTTTKVMRVGKARR
ncbi:hypothetical protein HU200_040815 [Digitaria exilis]|uniref:Uncharacterized protein n=1 Tax=Digitaria exilis TaxID=1010633 RepID=A0A835B837_9POAL|nr:hypothetical protein HU200_040815 [Digitaria exilis]